MVRSWPVLALLAACRLNFEERAAPADGPDLDASGQVRIRVVGFGAVTGPGGIACADDCSVTIAAPVTLTAVPGEAQQLAQFCTAQPTCEVMPGGDVTATFMPAPITANRVFVTSQLAVLGSGRAGLDMQCATAAGSAGLGGTWLAFVSTTAQDAVARLSGSRGWVRLDGLPLLDQPSQIGSDSIPRGIAIDERAAPHPTGFAMTGSNADGTLATGNTCGDWMVTTGQVSGSHLDSAQRFFIGSSTQSTCMGYLYCFEVGKTVAVTVAPPAFPVGRYVFVSTGFDGVSGVAGADAACQADASAAGLPGSYKAVLATTTSSALDHVGSLAGPWRRPDGASVTRTGLDNGNFSTTIGMTAGGAPAANFAAFGAQSLGQLGTMTCGDWSDASVSTTGITVGTYRMSAFAAIGYSSCVARTVICVQTQ